MLLSLPHMVLLLQLVELTSPTVPTLGMSIGVVMGSSDRSIVDAAVELIRHDFSDIGSLSLKIHYFDSFQVGSRLITVATAACDFLQDGVGGVVGHVDCETAHILSGILAPRTVPTILILPPDCLFPLPFGIFRLRPDPTHVNTALRQILRNKNRTLKEISFYDINTEPAFIQMLFENHTDLMKVGSIFVHEQLDESHYELMSKLSGLEENVIFLLFCKEEMTKKLLDTAVSLHLNTAFQSWLVLYNDPISYGPSSVANWKGGNLVLLTTDYLPLGRRPCPLELSQLMAHVPLNMSFEEAMLLDAILIFNKAIKVLNSMDNTTFNSSKISLDCLSEEIDNFKSGQALADYIRNNTFKGTSGVTSFTDTAYNSRSVVNIWAVDPDAARGRSLRAQWMPENRLVEHFSPILVNPPNNFRNRTLKVGLVQSPPYVFVTYGEEKRLEASGFCIEIVQVLAGVLNFSIEYVDGGEDYGSRARNGKWTGMMAMVINKEVDFAIGAFTVTEEREEDVAFTMPFYQDRSGILLKRPGEGPGISRVFLPFHVTVWMAISVSITAVGLVLLAVRYSLRDNLVGGESNGMHTASNSWRRLVDNLWFAYGTFVEQSMEQYPQCQSGRVLVAFWWLFTIIMSASYTANLVAYLTVSISEQPISNLEDLANDPIVLPLVLQGNSLNDQFSDASPEDLYGRIWQQLEQVPPPLPNTTEEALALVRTGRFALINDIAIIGHYANEECEDFIVAEESFRPSSLAFILPKDSVYKELFDINLVKMEESGLIQKWRSLWWQPSACGATPPGLASQWTSMDLHSLMGAFLVLAGAVVVALFTLGLEILTTNSRRGSAPFHSGGDRRCHGLSESLPQPTPPPLPPPMSGRGEARRTHISASLTDNNTICDGDAELNSDGYTRQQFSSDEDHPRHNGVSVDKTGRNSTTRYSFQHGGSGLWCSNRRKSSSSYHAGGSFTQGKHYSKVYGTERSISGDLQEESTMPREPVRLFSLTDRKEKNRNHTGYDADAMKDMQHIKETASVPRLLEDDWNSQWMLFPRGADQEWVRVWTTSRGTDRRPSEALTTVLDEQPLEGEKDLPDFDEGQLSMTDCMKNRKPPEINTGRGPGDRPATYNADDKFPSSGHHPTDPKLIYETDYI